MLLQKALYQPIIVQQKIECKRLPIEHEIENFSLKIILLMQTSGLIVSLKHQKTHPYGQVTNCKKQTILKLNNHIKSIKNKLIRNYRNYSLTSNPQTSEKNISVLSMSFHVEFL